MLLHSTAFTRLGILLLGLGAIGCQPPMVSPEDDTGTSAAHTAGSSHGDALAGYVCSSAAAHVASCQGGEALPSGECDTAQAAAAASVLDQSCEELATTSTETATATVNDGNAICIALLIPMLITNVPPGGLCCFSYQCANNNVNTCSNHRCRPRLAAGGACGTNDNLCAKGLTCLPSKRCGTPAMAGAACSERSDCATSLTCGADGTCGAALGDGEACTRDDHCQHSCIGGTCAARSGAGGACEDRSDCDGFLACVNQTCSAPGLGSSCAQHADCMGSDRGLLVCAFNSCAPPAKTGERCDTTASFPCAEFGDTCFSEKCEPRHAQGEACTRTRDCAHGFCNNGRCS